MSEALSRREVLKALSAIGLVGVLSPKVLAANQQSKLVVVGGGSGRRLEGRREPRSSDLEPVRAWRARASSMGPGSSRSTMMDGVACTAEN